MHLFSLQLIINILKCFYLVTLIKGRTVHRSEDVFPLMVETLLDELNRSYSMTDTISKAREKLQETEFETWNEMKKSAALIINIFTSSDIINIESEMSFYRMLQEQLRSGHPNEIWKRCEDLLNRALKIIGVETFDHLYRGEWDWPASFPEEGQAYFVPSFWSTSLDPVATSHFGGDKDFFYYILGAKGTRIENISVLNEEKEVLLPSARRYVVVRVLRNDNEIRKELNRISKRNNGTDLSTFKPKILIVLAEETYYIRMNITTGATTQYGAAECETNLDVRMNITTGSTTQYGATESETNLDAPENCSGYKEFKLVLYLAFCIYVLNKGIGID